MEKNAVIQVKSFSDIDESDAIEVITPGKFIVKLYMKSQRFLE